MAKSKNNKIEEVIVENISKEPLEEVMGNRYATYAKYVIQDRAIPDVRDGMKPVQRRIIFSMYQSGNTFNKPTKKCAHTVGAVMGTFHPHGDTSIYEALARMSQDWKVRYPLVDFQGNNGSIDGDGPAAYRYTESRLSEISNELVKEIDKNTVDMQLNFDDTEFEPVVLPCRFPNLLANGTEGIAVALATEIPPHNLRELSNAIIYRINHKHVTVEDLRQFVLGPDFPGGGYIYKSEGLDSIYKTGKGRIEVTSKSEIVYNKDNAQIIITELPYKAVKINTVHEIDLIRHSKAIDGIIEVLDESDWKGIRIVITCKKDAKVDLILNYLLSKTSLQTSYTANMVAIVDGRPKTLSLLDYVDAYIAHQVEVIKRKTKFDLTKVKERLHIVEGLILASLNIKDIIYVIEHSSDKADSKANLMAKYSLSAEQAESIVMMPLYKISKFDQEALSNEKETLEVQLKEYQEILNDENKLNKVLIKDLKTISDKYGDERRSQIIDKVETKPIDKRDLIAKEEIMLCITRDGYIKRSSVKSFKGSNEAMPGKKDNDLFVGIGLALTTDYVICFTNKGNYFTLPVHIINENKWKDNGTHVNDFITLGEGEKIIKAFILKENRNDLYLAILTKIGQIKRIPLSQIEVSKRSRPSRCMKILPSDEVVSVALLSGNSDLVIITNNGMASRFNENELTIVSSNAGGVKSINGLGYHDAISLLAFEENEKTKFIIITDKGHERVIDADKIIKTGRLGKTSCICSSFKNDVHLIVGAAKLQKQDSINFNFVFDDDTSIIYKINDLHMTDVLNAKKNMDIPAKTNIVIANNYDVEVIDKSIPSHPILNKEIKNTDINEAVPSSDNNDKKQDEETNFEQISIFDDLDN